MKPVTRTLCLIFFISFLQPTFLLGEKGSESKNVVILESSKEKYELGRNLNIIEDKEKTLTILNISSSDFQSQFYPSTQKSVNLGFTNSTYWFQFTVKNISEKEKFLIEIGYPLIDQMTFYYLSGDKFVSVELGDKFPFHQRSHLHNNFVIPVQIRHQEKVSFYIKVETESTMTLPIVLWEESAFYKKDHQQQYLNGLYFGIIAVMAIYNLFVFLSIRDRSYLYYVVFIASFALYQLAIKGIAYEYLWPNSTFWNNLSPPILASISLLSMAAFSKYFLEMPNHLKTLDKLNSFIIALLVLIVSISPLVGYSLSNRLVSLSAPFVALFIISSAVISWGKKFRAARFFLLAWFSFLCGIILYVMRGFGVLPTNFLTLNGMPIGSIALVILLSFALADRINILRRKTEEAQEEALRQQQIAVENLEKSNEVKDMILANTSHELRTPLHGMTGVIEGILKFENNLTLKQRNNLSIVIESGKRLLHQINDLIDFSKLKSHEMKLNKTVFDVENLFQIMISLLDPLAAVKKLELVSDIEEDCPLVMGDMNRMYQVLQNLIGNAIKFTKTGSVTLAAKKEGDQVRISVIDTGIGIPEDMHEKIFLDFEQVDASAERSIGGAGLGLSITKHILELHDSKIELVSEPSKGSTFSFLIPMADEQFVCNLDPNLSQDILRIGKELSLTSSIFQDDSNNTDDPWLDVPKNGKKVLVVDDNSLNRKILKDQLEPSGYEVIMASSGQQCLDIVEESVPDIILLDFMMPKMNGIEVCQRIREKYHKSQVPIIMITAKQEISTKIQGLEMGANDYLQKPFEMDEMLVRVKSCLNTAFISKSYERFVPSQFLKFLSRESILDIQLGDQVQQKMSILFSDIRDFTSLSEKMTPQENFNFMNSYLEKMGPVIRQNNGFIDKFIGDEIMALFAGRADDAVDAAINMQKELEIYNQRRFSVGYSPIDIGIGINTGDMMLGIIGESNRMEGTVISDAVNLAARIQGLSKAYGTPLLVTSDTFTQMEKPWSYSARFIDSIRLRGKEKSTTIFEILDGYPEPVLESKKKIAEDFDVGFQHFQVQEYDDAKRIFERCLKECPGDTVSAAYIKRINELTDRGDSGTAQDGFLGEES